MPSYKLRPEAKKDLGSIWKSTVKKWGVDQAKAYHHKLTEAFEFLTHHPHAFPEQKQYDPPIRFYHKSPHIIIYTASGNEVVIIRILHESMELDKCLSS